MEKNSFKSVEKYCLNIARRDRNEKNIPILIGSSLIYHQLIECEIKKVIELNLQLVRTRMYPSTLLINTNLDDLTFGKIIVEFEKYLVEYEQEKDLKKAE